MSELYVGIDLGTSAVKLVAADARQVVHSARCGYDEISPKGWREAVARALRGLRGERIAAIGLSSQTGSYIVNERTVIPWNDAAGAEELAFIKAKFTREQFLQELDMEHPNLVSYPLPRLLYIKRHHPDTRSVCQPKDFIAETLTGRRVSDPYTWRGLARGGAYRETFLQALDIPSHWLPELADPFSLAGLLTNDAAARCGIEAGTPVYTGMNDFFCALLGMNITVPGTLFDITGTSEHLGILCAERAENTKLVSSPYLAHYVHYGVTSSSGAALDFGLNVFGLDGIDPKRCLERHAPIFLPDLKGRRTPITDSAARGAFVGIAEGANREDMAYAVLEGSAFSAYHIYETLGKPRGSRLTLSGGAAKNELINRLKATLFPMPLGVAAEESASAMGAVIVAAAGKEGAAHWREIAERYGRGARLFAPLDGLRDTLLKRYEIYRGLYPALKESFGQLQQISI